MLLCDTHTVILASIFSSLLGFMYFFQAFLVIVDYSTVGLVVTGHFLTSNTPDALNHEGVDT